MNMIDATYSWEHIIAACDQETLNGVVTPAKEGSWADQDRVSPDDCKDSKSHSRWDLLARESLDNDIVPVIANKYHGHDGACSKDGSKTSIKLTSFERMYWKNFTNGILVFHELTKSTPHPVSLSESINDDWETHGGHHAEIREGKINNKHVRGRPQILNLQEDVANTAIAKEVYQPQEEEADSNNMVNERMLWGEGTPMFINNLQGFFVNSIKMGCSL